MGPLDKIFHIVSSKAQLYHDWIEWVVMTDRASTFVENPYNRKYAKMDGISRTTYDKYKDRLHVVMENVFLHFSKAPGHWNGAGFDHF